MNERRWEDLAPEERFAEFEMQYLKNQLRSQQEVQRRRARDPLADLRRRRASYETEMRDLSSGPWDETVAMRALGTLRSRVQEKPGKGKEE